MWKTTLDFFSGANMKLSESNSLLTSMRPRDILEFQDRLFHVLRGETLFLLAFYYWFCTCLCRWCSFNLSLRHLLPFHLSYVTISKRYCLSEFYPDIASLPQFFFSFLFFAFFSSLFGFIIKLHSCSLLL